MKTSNLLFSHFCQHAFWKDTSISDRRIEQGKGRQMKGQSLSNSKGFAQQIRTISSSRTPSPHSSQAGSPALPVLSWGHHTDLQLQNTHRTFSSAPRGSRVGAGPPAGLGEAPAAPEPSTSRGAASPPPGTDPSLRPSPPSSADSSIPLEGMRQDKTSVQGKKSGENINLRNGSVPPRCESRGGLPHCPWHFSTLSAWLERQ